MIELKDLVLLSCLVICTVRNVKGMGDTPIMASEATLDLHYSASTTKSTIKQHYCYDCEERFRDMYNPGDCVSNVTNTFKPRKCQAHEKFCKVEWTKVNGLYTVFERNCQSDCESICRIRGFGLWEETCRYCCDSSKGCNIGAGVESRWRPTIIHMDILMVIVWAVLENMLS